MNGQLEKDANFYWSVCVLHRLRDMGLITPAEYSKIKDISADYYGTKIIVL